MCDCDCELPKVVKWQQIRDAHASSLAKKIRQEASDAWDRGNQAWGSDDAADFIDPGVTC